jgi:hypothetical protein
VFVNNAAAITPGAGAVPVDTYNDLSGNTRIGVTPESTDKTGSPGYNTSTYGIGAYLMPAPNFRGRGSGGAEIGAHITYEYVNGVLTSTPLWPWPMESRILADTGRSVTYASGGGIWKTLAGVYP